MSRGYDDEAMKPLGPRLEAAVGQVAGARRVWRQLGRRADAAWLLRQETQASRPVAGAARSVRGR
jgi:hypothetical protein